MQVQINLLEEKLFIITIIEKKGKDVKGKTCIFFRLLQFFIGNSTKSVKIAKKEGTLVRVPLFFRSSLMLKHHNLLIYLYHLGLLIQSGMQFLQQSHQVVRLI